VNTVPGDVPFRLDVRFPGASTRTADLPDLRYVPEPVRVELLAALDAHRKWEKARDAVENFGRPTPDPEHNRLKEEMREAEAEAARIYESAQLTAAAKSGEWKKLCNRGYYEACQRITRTIGDLVGAVNEAATWARMRRTAREKPIELKTLPGSRTPVDHLVTPVHALAERLADLPGVDA
jgi:hypothetical protein